MTPTEATDLAVRILQSFNGPPATDWEEELAQLDAGRAGTAYARLRREHDGRWLSIARYLETYRSLNTDDASTRQPDCGWCDNTGWIPTNPHTAHGEAYTGVQPCPHCAEGRARAGSAAWTQAPTRDFITPAEAERLDRVNAERRNPRAVA